MSNRLGNRREAGLHSRQMGSCPSTSLPGAAEDGTGEWHKERKGRERVRKDFRSGPETVRVGRSRKGAMADRDPRKLRRARGRERQDRLKLQRELTFRASWVLAASLSCRVVESAGLIAATQESVRMEANYIAGSIVSAADKASAGGGIMRKQRISEVTATAAESHPAVLYPFSFPSAPCTRIKPPKNEPSPDERCCTAELTPMNPPRRRGATAEVMRAIAGTNRPDMQIMNKVVTATATLVETGGR